MTIVLAHGAGAGRDHPWMQRVSRAFEARGFRVVTFDFPYVAAGRRAPDRAPVLEACFADIWAKAAAEADGPMSAAGKSMGGRIASQVAAKGGFEPAPAALVFFGYPLHPPGRPGQRRDAHLPRLTAPMLFLHGTRDPFGTPEEMRALAASLPTTTLELIDGGDHSLVATKTADPSGLSLERAVGTAADWLLHRHAGTSGAGRARPSGRRRRPAT
jgi:predicted alpha/beta-hydrolase family hydrolase